MSLELTIAAVTWAFVSPEVDHRLRAQTTRQIALAPEEWTSGEIAWLVDAVGDLEGVIFAIKHVLEGPLKSAAVHVLRDDDRRGTKIEILDSKTSKTIKQASSK